MAEGSEIVTLLDALDALVAEAAENRTKWRGVWAEIKRIGASFKGTKFTTVQERQRAWNRFQAIITRVKEGQQEARTDVEREVRESEYHLEQIRSYAYSATPSSEMADVLLAICTGGISIFVEAGLNAILGPFDERKMELQRCSEAMKSGWAHLTQNKGDMLGKQKKEAFNLLNAAEESLDAAWDTWKAGKQQVLDHYHGEKRAAREEKHAKREAREAKIVENIAKLEERLDRLQGALQHRHSHLAELEEKRDSAWNDSFRERVDGWISEERDRISDIERQLDQVRGWLSEAREKLR